jgi:hypothetical protein
VLTYRKRETDQTAAAEQCERLIIDISDVRFPTTRGEVTARVTALAEKLAVGKDAHRQQRCQVTLFVQTGKVLVPLIQPRRNRAKVKRKNVRPEGSRT